MNGPGGTYPDASARLEMSILLQGHTSTLASDVLRGLRGTPKSIPPKHFYDERGSDLFDRICETAEYYQTRAELRLLEDVAPLLMDSMRPTDVIELGSGAARKTRLLFDAAERCRVVCRYVPFDVSESALRKSAERLLERYPWLRIHGVVGDYDQHLGLFPSGARRLFVFLGGTIGNFDPEEATAFLRKIRSTMLAADRFLLGMDLVKEPEVLDRAYNDAQGLTEAFNKNVLLVINRELGGNFDPDAFRHVAFFNREAEQIEMHLEASRTQEVCLTALDERVTFRAGERLRTEISRKFTRQTAEELLHSAGLALQAWHAPPDGAFGLSISAPA